MPVSGKGHLNPLGKPMLPAVDGLLRTGPDNKKPAILHELRVFIYAGQLRTEKWWRCRDLNPGHYGYEPYALTG